VLKSNTVAPATTTNPGRISRARKTVAGALLSVAFLVAGPVVAASASTSTDPTDGAGTSLFTTLGDYLKDHLIAAFFGLAVIGIIVGMALSWARKGAKSK
jgi:hypothetical protein